MKACLYLLGIVLFFSCSEQDFDHSELLLGKEHGQIKTKVIEVLTSYGFIRPNAFIKSGSQLYIADRRNHECAYSIDLNNGDKKSFYPRVRTKSGEITLLNSMAASQTGGWSILNFNTGQMMLHAQGLRTRGTEESVIQLPKRKQHLWAVCVGKAILSTGLYEEGRYQLYSPESGKTNYYLSYPDHPGFRGLKEKTKSILYANNVLRVHPDQKLFVCADLYSGMIEVGRVEEEHIELVKRQCLEYARVEIEERLDFPCVSYLRSNRMGFVDVAVSDDRIFALYSGKSFDEAGTNFQYGRTLIELDWEGQILASYQLDRDLSNLSYDLEEQRLYGLSCPPEITLLGMDLPDAVSGEMN